MHIPSGAMPLGKLSTTVAFHGSISYTRSPKSAVVKNRVPAISIAHGFDPAGSETVLVIDSVATSKR